MACNHINVVLFLSTLINSSFDVILRYEETKKEHGKTKSHPTYKSMVWVSNNIVLFMFLTYAKTQFNNKQLIFNINP
jgi:hypothetical protein